LVFFVVYFFLQIALQTYPVYVSEDAEKNRELPWLSVSSYDTVNTSESFGVADVIAYKIAAPHGFYLKCVRD